MNKETIIERLEATLKMMKELPQNAFNYTWYVSKTDGQDCGTMCCIAGWYPKFFKEAGLIWGRLNGKLDLLSENGKGNPPAVDPILSNYHGISMKSIDHLFYGVDYKMADVTTDVWLENDIDNELEQVINVWEKFINLMKTDANFYDHATNH